jgi:geranylgeranyl pyrophosphate synthase
MRSLVAYKKLVDDEIARFATQSRKNTTSQYGDVSATVYDEFLRILGGKSKRIRGTLTLIGYEMSGGTDIKTAVVAARVIEMMHAYLLIIDDIQDKSTLRRGEQTVYSKLGPELAINAALAGMHVAQMSLANLSTDADTKIALMNILNRTMTATVHGQTKDLVFSKDHTASVEVVLQMYRQKTAEYTFLNPLHTGMVLAGADCHATDAITDYAIHAGIAYQIKNDLEALSMYQTANDDIVGNKHTIVIAHALCELSAGDRTVLQSMLGSGLSEKQYKSLNELLEVAGSISYASTHLKRHINGAAHALNKEESRWPATHVSLLREILSHATL